jgi:hypothetical protein
MERRSVLRCKTSVVYLVLLTGCAVGRRHKSDAKLEINFLQHEFEFQALLADVQADKKLHMIDEHEIRYGDQPTDDPVEEWLTIDPYDVTARLMPHPELSEDERSRMQDAIDLLGLNLDPNVRTQRSRAYEVAARAASAMRWDELQQSAMRHRPHSLAARIVLQRVVPERLPSPGQEMRDLAGSLWKELRTLVCEIQNLRARGSRASRIDERQLQAIGWALIIVRTDPPAGDPATAAAYLGELLERERPEVRSEIALFRPLR